MTETADSVYERVLILRGQMGDNAAFAELVARYHARLGYYLRKMLGDPHQAEDVLQDVWFDVFRALPRLVDPAAFAAWVYRIARDRAFRLLRKKRLPIEPVDEHQIEAGAAEEEFTAEEAAQIHAALDRLSPERREALILRFVEDMSYEKIAEVAGVPVGTVRSRLHLAKRDLRNLLEEDPKHGEQRTGKVSAGGRPGS